VTDIETYLKSKLNESIDADLGPRRPAPPFHPVTPTRTWVRPVLAAASVLVVVGAAVAIGRSASTDHTQPPATGQPTRPTHPVTTHQSAPPPLGTTVFHDAKIAVPTGWTAHPKQGSDQLCLSPSKKASDCAIQVAYFVPGTGTLDVDEPGGYYGDQPQWCAPQVPKSPQKLTGTANRDFGGRPAQWRAWELDCPDGRKILDEQYVVPTSPGFVLYAHNPTSDVHDAIDAVAQHSQLPAQNAPLWLTDRGRVQSVSATVVDGRSVEHLVLDRFGPDGTVGTPPMLVSYDLAPSVYQNGDSPQAGATVYLATDGHTVLLIQKR
jgi:hypothetical protein